MSARDDHPLGRIDLGTYGVHYTFDPNAWHELCAEIDRLRATVERLTAEVEAQRELTAMLGDHLEGLAGRPLSIVSVGPDRNQTFVR